MTYVHDTQKKRLTYIHDAEDSAEHLSRDLRIGCSDDVVWPIGIDFRFPKVEGYWLSLPAAGRPRDLDHQLAIRLVPE